jgi:hypothetical protein
MDATVIGLLEIERLMGWRVREGGEWADGG